MSMEYYEDIKPHQKHRSREYYLSEEEIVDYAKKWDPQPFHIDPEHAKNTVFGGLVASGAHLYAILMKLENEKRPRPAWITVLGLDKIKFLSAARPGDVLGLVDEVISKWESKSNSNAGIVHSAGKLINQQGEIVLTVEGIAMLEKRPANGTPSSQSSAR